MKTLTNLILNHMVKYSTLILNGQEITASPEVKKALLRTFWTSTWAEIRSDFKTSK
ncbi:hypothetical protein STRDD10_01356 [Streptococcus sp. DD10]|uniref:hypothetical protein n=1 Tax=Streptococcus sp. DD10 TaxID=1777878 RepID=UPI0007989DEF|nr:hypothetical protein [Streptococcus sp. DD10]KXT73790.1 hypothetical protein STRDD10_01356 [Streptococcus sp. DD10]